MSTKTQRAETIARKASEMALSGRFTGWRDIERALDNEGYAEARAVLDRDGVRKHLDSVCKANWKAPAKP